MRQPTLPPDLALLSRIVDAEPPDVQELFQYALTMRLIEDGKAQIVERRKIDCREWLTVLTVADELPQGHRQAGCEGRKTGAVAGRRTWVMRQPNYTQSALSGNLQGQMSGQGKLPEH